MKFQPLFNTHLLVETRNERECKHCKRKYNRFRSRILNGKHIHYCSHKCYLKNRKINASRKLKHYRYFEKRKCNHCCDEFTTRKDGAVKFCSRRCASVNRRHSVKYQVCEGCCKIFITKTATFCSLQCAAKVRKRGDRGRMIKASS